MELKQTEYPAKHEPPALIDYWHAEAIQAREDNRELSRQLDWMQGLAFWLAMGLIVSAAVFLHAAGWM